MEQADKSGVGGVPVIEIRADGQVILDGNETNELSLLGESLRVGENKIEKYRAQPLERFLTTEVRLSLGDYLLLDAEGEQTRVVTSLGYSGGYLVEADETTFLVSTLREAVSILPEIELNEEVVRQFITCNINSLPMYSTILKDVTRLPSGYVVEIEEGAIKRRYGYFDSIPAETPDSFSNALDEIMAPLADTARAEDRTVTVTLSGGVDSLSLLLALRNQLSDEYIRVVTCRQGRGTNGEVLVDPLSRKLGFDVTYVGDDSQNWPPQADEVYDHIDHLLAQDAIRPVAPHHALTAEYGNSDDIVLTGQNMGIMLRAGRGGSPTPLPSGFPARSAFGQVLKTRPSPKPIVYEFTTSSYYTNHRPLRRLYQTLYNRFSDANLNFDASIGGYLTGLYNVGMPNVLDRDDLPGGCHKADVSADISRFFAEITEGACRNTVDSFLFYGFSNVVQHQVCNLPTPSGSTVSLPAMWGPFASYFRARPRGIRQTITPKRLFYKYVKDQTGSHHGELTDMTPSRVERIEQGDSTDTNRSMSLKIGKRNRELLDPGESRALELIGDGEIKQTLEQVYSEAGNHVDNDETFAEARYQTLPSIVNLERILQA